MTHSGLHVAAREKLVKKYLAEIFGTDPRICDIGHLVKHDADGDLLGKIAAAAGGLDYKLLRSIQEFKKVSMESIAWT